MTDKIKLERLKKIRALALMGVPGGEREAAQALLDKLMKKYDVSISELKEEEVKEYIFEYHGTEQKQLLHQIIYKVTNTPEPVFFVINNSGHKCRTKVGAYCTAAQNIEIRFL